MNKQTLVIGVGNVYRGDDGAGPAVARSFSAGPADNLRVCEQSGEGAALIDAWHGADAVYVIDAVDAGSEPGAVFRFDASAQSLPACFFAYSTHAFSVAEGIELARVLRQLPPRLVVYGIQGASFKAGAHLSVPVQLAVARVADRIREELKACDA